MPKSNVARRIEAVIVRAAGVSGEPNVAEAWVTVLGLDSVEPAARDREVARRLALLQEQVHDLRESLEGRDVDSSTYKSQLAKVDHAFALRLLGRQWGDVRNQLTTDVVAVIGVLRELLPDETPSEEDLKQLTEVLDRLEEWIAASDLPVSVRAFLVSQVFFIRTAIGDFAYRGARAFEDASDQAARSWVQHAAEVAPYKGAPELRAVQKLWPAIARWGRGVLLIGNLAKLILLDGSQMIEGFHQLLTGIDVEEVPDSPLLLGPPSRQPSDATQVDPDASDGVL